MQKLRHDKLAHTVMHGAVEEHDPFLQQARENIVSAFTPAGLFHHHRDEVHVGFYGIGHCLPVLSVSPLAYPKRWPSSGML